MLIDKTSVVIITGASSGLGEALATATASRGARIALVARRLTSLQAVAARVTEAGGTPLIIQADVSQEAECQRIVQTTMAAWGTVDALINNAGRGNRASVEHTTTADLDEMFRLNVYSQFWLSGLVLPVMKAKRSGYIVNISSFAGKVGFPYNAAYVAAKHAVVGFTASLRAELTGTGVEAFCACPAGIVTDWANVSTGGAIGDIFATGIKASRTIARDRALPLAPLTRMMSAEDVADLIVQGIETGRIDDLYTHADTKEQALLASGERTTFEDRMMPLYLGMQEAYVQHVEPQHKRD